MENERELKIRFAEELLKRINMPNAGFEAGMAVFGNVGLALQVANTWVSDTFVLEQKLKLLDEKGLRAFLPTKEEQAADVYRMANDIKLDEEIRLKAHELYARIMGNIEKPAPPNAGLAVFAQNVMIVKEVGKTDDEWEQRATEHQRALTLNAANC